MGSEMCIRDRAITIDGISIQTTSGTCNVQITVDGAAVGSVYSASSTTYEAALGTPIQIDATLQSHSIGYVVTSANSAANLEVTLSVAISAT